MTKIASNKKADKIALAKIKVEYKGGFFEWVALHQLKDLLIEGKEK